MVLLSSFMSADRIIEFLKMGTLPMTVSWWTLLFSSSDRMEEDSGFLHHGIALKAKVLYYFAMVFGVIGNWYVF